MDKLYLKRLRTGVYGNPSDPQFDLKSYYYQKHTPDSPLHHASMLVRAGKYSQAKDIYRRLLRAKETLYVHLRLAPLLSGTEALEMVNQYQHVPKVRDVYQQRANQVSNRVRRGGTNATKIILIAILALLVGMMCGTALYFVHNRIITVDKTTNNQILYINQLPSLINQPSIRAQDASISSLVDAVDNANLKQGQSYVLLSSNKAVGYAIRSANNRYAIYVLKNTTGSTVRGNGSNQQTAGTTSTNISLNPSGVTPLNLNVARTAYAYYLTTHNDLPPASLQPISKWVPSQQILSEITYNPTTNPATALTTQYSIPYEQPEIFVNLATKQLQVTYGGKTLLKTSVGIGSKTSPTLTGQFRISDRITSSNQAVYGPYIFPLDGSHYAIHGTNDTNRVGKAMSIGCVEVPPVVDRKLYHLIPVGTKVTIANGNELKPPTWFLG